jgi:hypothetical protein
MKKYLHILFLSFLALTFIVSTSSCHRGPSCPAYGGIDPGFSTPNPDSEQRKAIATAKNPRNNKREVEKKKKEQLKGKRFNRKKSTNLFPSYMRKK